MGTPLDIVTLPNSTKAATTATERLQVELADDNATLKVKQQSYAEGLGWFTQKTLAVNIAEAPDLIQQLQQLVISAKLARSQPDRALAAHCEDEGKLLEFPAARRPATVSPTDHNDNGKLLTFPTR